MAKTASIMTPLGSNAPAFTLPDCHHGKMVSLSDFNAAAGLLVIFMCNHCPYVIHIRTALALFCREYQEKGLAIIGINANDVFNYTDDSPENMVQEVAAAGYKFPYLFDANQEVAKAYGAACTPDFFLYDAEQKLAYRGQFDNSRPGSAIEIDGCDLRAATNAVLSHQPAPSAQKPSLGCNIKWKPGNEPEYFKI